MDVSGEMMVDHQWSMVDVYSERGCLDSRQPLSCGYSNIFLMREKKPFAAVSDGWKFLD